METVKMSSVVKKVSLILTTYNCKENLIKTFKSIEEQDYSNLEVCISDSCSTDGTLEVIEEYAKTSKHSVVYKSEKDFGIYDGINRSIQMSSGDYLEIMNDEYTCTDAISKLVGAIEEAGDVVGAHADLVYKEGDTVRRYWKMRNGSIYSGWMPGHPSLMLKREVYEKYGFCTNLGTDFRAQNLRSSVNYTPRGWGFENTEKSHGQRNLVGYSP